MQTDAALVEQVISGDDAAFDELYRRHASAAWRLAQGVTGNAHDAADAVSEAFVRVLQAVRAGRLDSGGAFRPYLLTATRNAAIDGVRRNGRATPTDTDALPDDLGTPSAAERVVGDIDALLIAKAFRNLPERWRSMLWLTEVEGVATKDAAVLLGLSANGAAQLAVRARAGLRERFLQAHLRETGAPGCRFTIDRLGAYVGGGLAPRDLAKVDQHLAGCPTCSTRKAELEDLGATLKRIALPMPLVLGASSAAAAKAAMTAFGAPALAAGAGGGGTAVRAIAWARTPPSWFQRAVAASSAAVLAVGVSSVGFHDVEGPVAEATARPVVPAATLPEPVAIDLAGQLSPVALSSTDMVGTAVRRVGTGPAKPLSADATERQEVTAAPPLSPLAPRPAAPREPSAPVSPPAAPEEPEPTSPIPLPDLPLPDGSGDGGTTDATPLIGAGVGATLHDVGASIEVAADEESSGGITVEDTTVGSPPPPPPAEDGITAAIGGELVPDAAEVSLP